MSREEMIRLARHCNLGLLVGPLFALLDDEWERLHRFAALVAAHEREACAKVCEDAISPYVTDSGGMKLVTLALAAAIRKRGEVKP